MTNTKKPKLQKVVEPEIQPQKHTTNDKSTRQQRLDFYRRIDIVGVDLHRHFKQ